MFETFVEMSVMTFERCKLRKVILLFYSLGMCYLALIRGRYDRYQCMCLVHCRHDIQCKHSLGNTGRTDDAPSPSKDVSPS